MLNRFPTNISGKKSNRQYAELWKNMLFCYTPFLGKAGNKISDISGNALTGTVQTSTTWSDGYPGKTLELGSAASTHSDGIVATTGYLDFSNGFCIELYYYLHTSFTSSATIFGGAFGVGDNVSITHAISTGSITCVSNGQSTTLVIPTNMTNMCFHLMYIQAKASSGDTTRGRAGISWRTPGGANGFAIHNGSLFRNQANNTLTPSAFTQLTIGNRKAVNSGLPALWTFALAYSTKTLSYDTQFISKRLQDPFGIFDINKKTIGKAPTVTSAFLPGQPFPGLPFPILAM